jgi:hypothetical protein
LARLKKFKGKIEKMLLLSERISIKYDLRFNISLKQFNRKFYHQYFKEQLKKTYHLYEPINTGFVISGEIKNFVDYAILGIGMKNLTKPELELNMNDILSESSTIRFDIVGELDNGEVKQIFLMKR